MIKEFLDTIKERGYKFGFVASGGFASLAKVFDTVGHSQTVTTGKFLCDPISYRSFLNSHEPEKYVHEKTAHRMLTALNNTDWTYGRQDRNNIINLAITGAMPTSRELRGGVRVEYTFSLNGDVWNGNNNSLDIIDVQIPVGREEASNYFIQKILNHIIKETYKANTVVLHKPDGAKSLSIDESNNTSTGQQICFYPGSFDPLHKGHRFINEDLKSRGFRTIFELSYTRLCKQRFSVEKSAEILDQFAWYNEVITTDESYFIGKREKFMKMLGHDDFYFAMGYDTFKRWMETYTPETHDPFNLIVYCRATDEGVLNPSDLYDDHHHRFNIKVSETVPPEISSTQLRSKK